MFSDEKLVLRLFQKESGGKLEGFEAAVAGALAGMVAQISTTPVIFQLNALYHYLFQWHLFLYFYFYTKYYIFHYFSWMLLELALWLLRKKNL